MGPALPRMLEEEPTVAPRALRYRRAGAAHDGRGPHRGHHRAAQAQVRGRDRDPHAQGAVQGDDPRQDQGPRPLQEADRRARDVRGRLAGARAQPGRRRSSSPRRSSAGPCRRASSPASRRASARRPRRACSPAIPLSDFKATLYDGSFHPVDSNELSFKIAASMALKDGVHNAKPALLEPIMTVEIRVPEAVHGRGQPRPQRPARPGPRHGHRRWRPDHHGARAPGRAVLLRDRAALAGPRPGLVHGRRSTTTRTCPATSRRRSSRSTARSSRTDRGATAPG